MSLSVDAIVFGGHYNGLGVVRALSRQQINVLCVDSHYSYASKSTYCDFVLCPDPHSSEGDFIEWLVKIGEKLSNKPVLFPTMDGWVYALSKYRNKLEPLYEICAPSWETSKLLIEKDLFYEWALKLKYPVPYVYSTEACCNDSSSISFPIICKPKYRRISSSDRSNLEIQKQLDILRFQVIENENELKGFIKVNERMLDYLLFQEYVYGLSDQMFTVGVYADENHCLKGVFTGHKRRGYPMDHGDCIVGESFNLPLELIEISEKIIRECKFSGIAEIEFKRSSRSGRNRREWYLIEINPRTWSWIGIVEHCGVNLVHMAYIDLKNKQTNKEPPVYGIANTGDVVFVRLYDDFVNCLHEYKAAGDHEYHMGFMAWIRDLRAKKVVFAELDKRDVNLSVFLTTKHIKSILKRFISKILSSCGRGRG